MGMKNGMLCLDHICLGASPPHKKATKPFPRSFYGLHDFALFFFCIHQKLIPSENNIFREIIGNMYVDYVL